MKNKPNILKSTVSKKCFSATRSIGSSLLLDFGKQIPYLNYKGQEEIKGEYGLLIEMGEWTLNKNNKQILFCERDAQKIEAKIHTLKGKTITSISLDQKNDLEIIFDKIYSLRIPFNPQESNLWTLYTPSGSYWLDQHGHWQHEK